MKKYSEKYLEKKLVEEVARHGGKALKYSSASVTGYPDRVCLFPNGGTVWAEIKTTGKHPTPLQQIRHAELRDLGFPVYIVENILDIKNVVAHGVKLSEKRNPQKKHKSL